MKQRSSFFWGMLALIVFFGAALVGYALNRPTEQPELTAEKDLTQAASLIEPYNLVFKEKYALCDEYNLGCAATDYPYQPSEDLHRLSEEEIRALYPQPQWSVFLDGQNLTITHLLEGLCPEHKKIMHLGLNQSGEYITICYGPSVVSSLGGVYLVSDIPFTALNEEQKNQILRGAYESTDLEELQGILDSFSEMH